MAQVPVSDPPESANARGTPTQAPGALTCLPATCELLTACQAQVHVSNSLRPLMLNIMSGLSCAMNHSRLRPTYAEQHVWSKFQQVRPPATTLRNEPLSLATYIC
eukprot:5311475-Heterocapsa_arctica.AAC.1